MTLILELSCFVDLSETDTVAARSTALRKLSRRYGMSWYQSVDLANGANVLQTAASFEGVGCSVLYTARSIALVYAVSDKWMWCMYARGDFLRTLEVKVSKGRLMPPCEDNQYCDSRKASRPSPFTTLHPAPPRRAINERRARVEWNKSATHLRELWSSYRKSHDDESYCGVYARRPFTELSCWRCMRLA